MVCPHVASFRPTFLSVVAYSRVVIDNYNKYMLVIKKDTSGSLNDMTHCSGQLSQQWWLSCVHSEMVVLVMVAMPVTAPCVVHVVLVAVGGVGCSRQRSEWKKILSHKIFLSSFQTPNHMTLFISNSSIPILSAPRTRQDFFKSISFY